MHDAAGGYIGRMKLLRIAGPVGYRRSMDCRGSRYTRFSQKQPQMAGAWIRLGLTVDSIVSCDDRADVVLSDGSRETYDLVVGADGIRSHVREMMFGKEYAPQFTGHGVWRFTAPRLPEIDHQIMYYGVGVKAGLMPVSDEQMYLLLVTNEPGNPWMPPEQLGRLLRERLRPFSAPLVAKLRDQINR